MKGSYQKILPIIETDRTIIRMANDSDIEEIIKYFTDNKSHLELFEPIKPSNYYTEEYWIEEIDNRISSFVSDNSLKLFIFNKEESNSIIGTVNFNNFVRGSFQACYLGYSLAEIMQGKGYINEALKSAINYLFSELNFHRIMANYMPHNRKSAKVLKRIGFTVEGYASNYLKINGEWEDHILTSLTNNNWEESSNN